MHIAYKNVRSTNIDNIAYSIKEQGSKILYDEHQSIIRNNNNDDMIDENSVDSISDVDMEEDVTYMDYTLNDLDPTDDISDTDDDVIMESYVLRQLWFPETTSAPKTNDTQSLQRVALILIACTCANKFRLT